MPNLRRAALLCLLAAGCDGNGSLIDTERDGCADIVVRESPGADWKCADSNSCTADYLAFPDKAAANTKPTPETEIDRKLTDIEAGAVDLQPSDDLRSSILDTLNMRFLVEGFDERPLKITVAAESESEGFHETSLLFEDPYVGTFKGILATPKSGGPSPGIVALHGHGEDAPGYRELYRGTEYPTRGYAILMITLRVMNIDEFEHEVTRILLMNGFNLIALRVYEAMLGLRYLSCRTDIDPNRLGLIGHSGGSSTGNLVVRIDPRVKAYVSDHQVDWFRSGTNEPYHCETAPDLYPYHALINDFSTAPGPVLQVLYGYLGGMRQIWDFFGERIG